jgi:hypothetical protein
MTGLLVLAGWLLAGSHPAEAQQAASLRDGAWSWGYIIHGKIPGQVPFVFEGESGCSLETAAEYFGMRNVVLMNGTTETGKWGAGWTSEDLDRLKNFKRVLCVLHLGDPRGAAKAAANISALSKKYPNVFGAMIDDFYPVETKLPVETLKDAYTALKSENPALKLYVVRYTHSKDEELIPYLPYFDVASLWVWQQNKNAWLSGIDQRVERFKQVTHKPVVIGLYLHDFGTPNPDKTPRPRYNWTKPVPMDTLEAQFVKTADLLRRGKIEGFIVPQNGWLDYESHRPQIQWTRQYLDWLFQTQTVRN